MAAVDSCQRAACPSDDRSLDTSDGSDPLAGLAASIARHGQAVLVLLRPHPIQPAHFQIAYGHLDRVIPGSSP